MLDGADAYAVGLATLTPAQGMTTSGTSRHGEYDDDDTENEAPESRGHDRVGKSTRTTAATEGSVLVDADLERSIDVLADEVGKVRTRVDETRREVDARTRSASATTGGRRAEFVARWGA